MQGWRVEMEDAHTALLTVEGFPSWSFFGVYDGHAGSGVSARCSTSLLPAILEQIAPIQGLCDFFRGISLPKGHRVSESLTKSFLFPVAEISEDYSETGPISDAIRSGFLQLDEAMRQLPEVQTGQDRSGKCHTPTSLRKFGQEIISTGGITLCDQIRMITITPTIPGSTAICCLVTQKHLFFANCGDSRAVLSRGGKVALSTYDHKPINPTEKERIQRAGGSVMIQRVSACLGKLSIIHR